MKRLIFLALVLALVVWAGCSKSGDGGPTGPGPSGPLRVVANGSVGTPGMGSADEAIWGGVTKYAVDLSTLNAPKLAPSASLSLPDSVYVQAISDGTDLFLRIEYADDSLNLLQDYLYCHDPANKNFTLELLGNQDQIFVMFFGLPDSAWDVWNWRSLGTAPARLAEDFVYDNSLMTVDSGGQEVTQPNDLSFQRPRWVHKTGPAFTGEILYIEDTSSITPFLTYTWAQNQIVPGYVVDTGVGGRVQIGQPYASSRWDVFTVHSYNSSANRLAVVLKRRLLVAYSQDLDLFDSVKTKIGVLDEQDDFSVGGSRRGLTKEFWLIL